MVGCSRMWCPVVLGLLAVGLAGVKGEILCPDGGAAVVGDSGKNDLDVGPLVPDGVVGGSQNAVAGAVDIVEGVVEGVAVLVGGMVLVVDMMVGPVVEEDQFDIGADGVVMMVAPVEAHLDLGGNLVVEDHGDVGVEVGEPGVEEEELADMGGTC